jgi:hypothetical protein
MGPPSGNTDDFTNLEYWVYCEVPNQIKNFRILKISTASPKSKRCLWWYQRPSIGFNLPTRTKNSIMYYMRGMERRNCCRRLRLAL